MSIGKNIKKLRLQHHMSQQELAKIAGVTDKAVSSWENDVKTPRMGVIQKLANHFNIKKSDIIEESSPGLKVHTVIKPPENPESLKPLYYHDPEVAQMANELKDNPGMRTLFDASRGLKKESIEEVVKFIEFQKAKERGDY